jgi:hypothetical protein
VDPEYEWRSSDISTLRDHTQAAHDHLFNVATTLEALYSDMNNDASLAGQWKDQFMAWLDLLQQYLTLLTDPTIGPAAVAGLDTFLDSLGDYDFESSLYASLKGV